MDCGNWNGTRLSTCAAFLVLSVPAAVLWAQDNFQVDAGVALLRGPAHGRVQTPRGGEPGTTSSHRPTLDELGIDNADPGDFWASVSRGHHGFYFGGRIVHLSGDSTLDTPLVSQGITFPAGSPVDAKVKFDWYRFGYRYIFPFDVRGRTIEIYPSIGGTILEFRYTLSSLGIETVDRSYAKLGAQAGVGGTWPFMDRFSLTVEARAPMPVPHWPQITSAQAVVKYRFLKRDDLAISGMVGLDYNWISYKDSQRVPNDIKADIGPLGLLGLEVSF
jgi:hypothetical protein